MLALLITIPWVLTVAALLVIIVRSNKIEYEDEEDELFDDDPEREVIRVVFYESDVVREPDFTTARPIDTMDLPANELKELLDILDELEQHKERD
jgi:hypothetical protein